MRKTLREHFSVKGTGIHTGVFSELDVMPSYKGKGIYFSYRNAEQSEQGFIPCHVANVVSTQRCTVLGNGQKTGIHGGAFVGYTLCQRDHRCRIKD